MIWKNDQVSGEETARILALARECLEVEGVLWKWGAIRRYIATFSGDKKRGEREVS